MSDATAPTLSLAALWSDAAHLLAHLTAERLGLLQAIVALGPVHLGVAAFEAGVGGTASRRHAVVLARLGLIDLDRSLGLNLSTRCWPTARGRAALSALSHLKEALPS